MPSVSNIKILMMLANTMGPYFGPVVLKDVGYLLMAKPAMHLVN
jgi:hypothetical protein